MKSSFIPPPTHPCYPHPVSVVFLAFALLGFSACKPAAPEAQRGAPPPVAVQIVIVEPTEIPRAIAAVGSLESPQTTEISTEIGGKLVFLDIPEGTQVQKGYVLARIDDTQHRAALTIAQARYQNAQDTLERLQSLSAKATSQQALDNAKAEARATKGQVEEAQSILQKTIIRAPFTGVLGLRQVSLGAYLDPGDSIVRLTQIQPLHLLFSLPQRYVLQIKTGQVARGMVDNCEERFNARVSVIDPFLDAATRSVRIQAVVPNNNRRLLPGMAAHVRLEVDQISDALLIPQEAVIRRGTKRLVYTIGNNDTAESKEVILGQFFPRQVQVESGLQFGDRVVATGHQKLRPGAKASPQPYEPIDNPNLALGSDNGTRTCEF